MRESAKRKGGSSGQQSARMDYEQAQQERARLVRSIKDRAPAVARGAGNVLLIAVFFAGLIGLAVASGQSSRQSESQRQLESLNRIFESQRQLQRNLAFDQEAITKMMEASRLLMAQDMMGVRPVTIEDLTPNACMLAEGEPLVLPPPPEVDASEEAPEGLTGDIR